MGIGKRLFWGFICVVYAIAFLSVWASFSPGRVGAGLSLGFAKPFEQFYDGAIYIMIGVLASYLRRESLLVLPTAFLLIMLARSLVELEMRGLLHNSFFLLATMLLFGMTISLIRSRQYWLCLVLVCPIAYGFAQEYVQEMPRFADPIYYMFGLQACTALILSCGVTIGFLMQGVRRHIKLAQRAALLPVPVAAESSIP